MIYILSKGLGTLLVLVQFFYFVVDIYLINFEESKQNKNVSLFKENILYLLIVCMQIRDTYKTKKTS